MSETSRTTEQPTGIAWGDSITPERLAELKEMFARQKAWAAQSNHDIEQSTFLGVHLTGSDVFWLAAIATVGSGSEFDAANSLQGDPDASRLFDLSALHLEGANLQGAQLHGADLRRAWLVRVNLGGAQLARANLSRSRMERAYMGEAQLQGANLHGAQMDNVDLHRAQLNRTIMSRAQLRGANLSGANLQGSDVHWAQLQKASLYSAQMEQILLHDAQLEGADLREVCLKQAYLRRACLIGVNLSDVQLDSVDLSGVDMERADLRRASFDKASRLNNVLFDGAILDQVIFDNTNLTVVPWEKVRCLGDEREAKATKGVTSKAEAFHAAARAYRSLSVALRNQGLGTDATRFHYRAELMERKSSWWQILTRLRSRRFYTAPEYLARWLGSLILGAIAGYGDRVWRTLVTYVVTIAVFALLFMQATHGWSFGLPEPSKLAPLPWYEALILSITSFHGRGFFQPLQSLGDPVAMIAAIEAVVGLFIEVIFIAAFTRRVTGN